VTPTNANLAERRHELCLSAATKHRRLNPRTNQMKTLKDAFIHTLQDIYYAENAITKALPKVIEANSHGDLKAALQAHLTETKDQITKL
jgi:hypothetical protein